ncbi:MAG TPA: glycosyltransferase family 4 protein [Gaiellaceae bacterium]|nr:glycosyltransferase family 4 protein [Gaiellaceae bacterium]
MRRRVLMVGRTRYRLPLDAGLARKFDALDEYLHLRVLASPVPGGVTRPDPRFVLLPTVRPAALDGAAFYTALAPATAREIRRFRPHAIVAESPQMGAIALGARRLAGRPAPAVITEVHGDWRTSTRLYGSPLRRLGSPLGDRLGARGVRDADAVRAISPYTAALVEATRGRPADAVFPTFSDLGAFADRPPAPLPTRPTALFVGVLERTKNLDGLVAAWPGVVRAVPEARLVVVGSGSLAPQVQELARAFPGGVEHHEELPQPEVARRMDESTVLCLPSRFEGLGRVVIESYARGRGVVVAARGGLLDLVDDEVEGLLVDPDESGALSAALARVLADPALARRLGEAARRRYAAWHSTPEEFARRLAELVDVGVANRRP